MNKALLFVAAALLISACGSASELAGSPGCAGDVVAPGDYKATNDFEAAGQVYWTIVPDSYDGSPTPVLMILGSGGGDPDVNYAAWRPSVEGSENLVVIVDTSPGVPKDPETFNALVDQLGSDYCIDLERVHLHGNSWSAGQTANLMCQMPETFASFADALGGFIVSICDPVPKPLVAWTGDPDRSAVTTSVEYWAEINGCDLSPSTTDLGSGITEYRYESCEADVVLFDFEGMGHEIPSKACTGPGAAVCAEYADFDMLETMEDFFATHPLN